MTQNAIYLFPSSAFPFLSHTVEKVYLRNLERGQLTSILYMELDVPSVLKDISTAFKIRLMGQTERESSLSRSKKRFEKVKDCLLLRPIVESSTAVLREKSFCLRKKSDLRESCFSI